MALTNNVSRTSRNGLITFGFDQGAAGSDDIVTAPTGTAKIVVVGFYLTSDVAGTLQIKDGTTVIGGTIQMGATGAYAWQGTLNDPWVELTAATKLAITSATCKISGFFIYRIVPE